MDYFSFVFSCACVFQRCCRVAEAEHTHTPAEDRANQLRVKSPALLCSRRRIILSTRCGTRPPRVSGVTVSEPNLFSSSSPVIALWPHHHHHHRHHPASRSSPGSSVPGSPEPLTCTTVSRSSPLLSLQSPARPLSCSQLLTVIQ